MMREGNANTRPRSIGRAILFKFTDGIGCMSWFGCLLCGSALKWDPTKWSHNPLK
jgi:hypothetical protein